MESNERARTLSLLALAAMLLAPAVSQAEKYEGTKKCKTCHEAKTKGSQITTWQGTDHSKAYEVLATEEAKKVGAKVGVTDPQNDGKCLKCHVTAYGAPAEKLGKKYAKEEGITCEACHGAGDGHVKARLSSDEGGDGFIDVPKTEITKAPDEKQCQTCHNKESPTFKSFKYADAVKKIAHPDPRKAKK